MDSLLILVVLFGGIFLYLLPAYVASKRKHSNASAIFVLNLFFGWTFIGWVLSLIWAATDNTKNVSV